MTTPDSSAPERRLSYLDTARVFVLAARVRLLDLRLNTLYRLADRRGREPDGDALRPLLRRWLACHEAMGALLPDLPEPRAVAEVREMLRTHGDAL